MALVWKHGTTAALATEAIQAELVKLSYNTKVAWSGNEFSSSVVWGTLLSITGKVTNDAVVLEKCDGALGGLVIIKSRQVFNRIFPERDKS